MPGVRIHRMTGGGALKPLIQALAAAALWILPAAAQPATRGERLTVVDYFHLLGSFEEHSRSHDWMLEERHGAVVDIPNGYLHAIGDGAQGPLWVCVFRRSDGTHLVGVKSQSPDTDEWVELRFHRLVDGRWADVTREVLPDPVRGDRRYDMPRYGTTIHVRDRAGRPLHDLAWTGERFVRRTPRPR